MRIPVSSTKRPNTIKIFNVADPKSGHGRVKRIVAIGKVTVFVINVRRAPPCLIKIKKQIL